MKNYRLGTFIAGMIVVGGTIFVSSTFAGTGSGTNGTLTVIRHKSADNARSMVTSHVSPARSTGIVDSNVVLVAPPGELPTAASANMVTSTKAFAPATQVTRRVAPTAKATPAARTARVESAQAPADKANLKNLFTLVRLLNYSPHPLNEDLLRQTPLDLNGNKYWFNVKYDEDWNVVGDEEGYMKGISFEIEVMENNQKVRSLKTPKVAINPAKIKKGQVLGIAEVAPYKFTISVEEFTKTKKGISELIFKLDLLG